MGLLQQTAGTRSLRDQVYQHLKEMIISGDLPAGTAVTQRDVAAKLGVSRTPVRDALFKLEQEGLIKSLHTGVVAVAEVPIEDIKRTFEVRALLEGFAARQATVRSTDQTITLLTCLIEQQKVAANEELEPRLRGKVFFGLDTQFHKTIVSRSENPRLISILIELMALTEFQTIQSKAVEVQGRIDKSISEHQQIVSLLKQGHSEAADGAMRAHLEGFCTDVISHLMR